MLLINNTRVASGFEEVTGYSLVGEQSTTSWEKLIHPQDLPVGVERMKLQGNHSILDCGFLRNDLGLSQRS
ncbi:hypothetical protein [Desulfonatronovibrio magnus]|uniref:hypothetical protein n=1 Tax=Desulfonatronovibrio magnus TaxID=698827 RepID=UPI0005EBA602|nr:hypothetical protein [Desulfonatronovibrio magnus]